MSTEIQLRVEIETLKDRLAKTQQKLEASTIIRTGLKKIIESQQGIIKAWEGLDLAHQPIRQSLTSAQVKLSSAIEEIKKSEAL